MHSMKTARSILRTAVFCFFTAFSVPSWAQDGSVPGEYLQKGADAYLQGIVQGKAISDTDAAWLVRQPELERWLGTYPGIAEEIAQHPYAASFVVGQPFFETWAGEYPREADILETASYNWLNMTPEEQEYFFQRNPNIRPDAFNPYSAPRPGREPVVPDPGE